MRKVKEILKQSVTIICLYYILKNIALNVLSKLNIATFASGGATHSKYNLQESVEYIEEVFTDYKNIANIDKFYGTVAEVGPGDNLGVALLCLGDGCKKVISVDRFYSKRDMNKNNKIYEELYNKHPEIKKGFYSDLSINNKYIEYHYGTNYRAESFFEGSQKYDFIISRAVLMHVDDPISALTHMYHSLNEGGYLLHKVDLRDLGMFSSNNYELKFLEISKLIYSLMTYQSGRPNRILLDQYLLLMEKLHCKFDIYITRLAGGMDVIPYKKLSDLSEDVIQQSLQYVRKYKHKFASEFRELDDEILMVAGFFMVVRK